jgi:hypothetical protein
MYLLPIGCAFILLPMCFLVLVNSLIRSFLYQPNENYRLLNIDDKKMSKYFSDYNWGDCEGLKFLCLWQKNKSDCPTIVVLHGNASSIIDMLSICFRIYSTVKVNVIVLSYPGYGGNTGLPSEQLIKEKLCGLMYLLIHKYLTNNDIYLYGISFGGAVALYLATVFQTKIRGLILENTFISITEMIKDVTGWNFVDKFQSFFSEKWDNVDSISRLEIPVLFFCSLNDTVITSRHMNELIKHTKSIHSVIRFDSDHNDLWEYDQNVNRMTSAFDKFIH